jgi:hypothetical protein
MRRSRPLNPCRLTVSSPVSSLPAPVHGSWRFHHVVRYFLRLRFFWPARPRQGVMGIRSQVGARSQPEVMTWRLRARAWARDRAWAPVRARSGAWGPARVVAERRRSKSGARLLTRAAQRASRATSSRAVWPAPRMTASAVSAATAARSFKRAPIRRAALRSWRVPSRIDASASRVTAATSTRLPASAVRRMARAKTSFSRPPAAASPRCSTEAPGPPPTPRWPSRPAPKRASRVAAFARRTSE